MPKNKGNKTRYKQASRDLLAFQALVGEEDADPANDATSPRPSSGAGRRGNVPVPGFKLREAADDARSPGSTQQQHPNTQDLQTMFPGISAEVIDAVAAAVGGSTEAALEALLAMQSGSSSDAGGASTSHQHQQQKALDGAAAHLIGETSSTGRAAAAAAAAASIAVHRESLWSCLPRECKQLIIDRLTMRDLARSARSCHELASYARAAVRNLKTISVPAGLSFEQMRGMCAAYANAGSVSLQPCHKQLRHALDFQLAFQAIARGTKGRAKALDLRQCAVTDGDVAELLRALPGLEELSLGNCRDLTDKSLKLLARHKPQQQQDPDLGIMGTPPPHARRDEASGDISGFRGPGPGLSNSSLIQQRMSAVKLHDVEQRLSSQPREAPRGLRSLSLPGLPQVTDEGLKVLLHGNATQRTLTTLDVSKCPRLTDGALALGKTSISVLKAGSCLALRDVRLHLPGDHPLRELYLPGCSNLTVLDVMVPGLETLNASNCKNLTMVAAEAPRLRRLHLALCPQLQDHGLELRCPGLVDASVFQCRSLTSAGIERVVSSAQGLESFNASGCIQVSRILLTTHQRLRTLHVTGCKSMVTLTTVSPCLTELQASGCTSLKNLEVKAPYLERLDLTNTAVSGDLKRMLRKLLDAPNPATVALCP